MRFNDSIYFTMDLDDFLIPSIGESIKQGITHSEMDEIFGNNYSQSEEDVMQQYKEHLSKSIFPLCKFVGLVSRIHNYINVIENKNHFPGVKTVIAMGLRKPFFKSAKKQDYFSANFSISTAYLASKELHGPNLFIENNVLQMICYNDFAKNLINYGLIIRHQTAFDPSKKNQELTWLPSENRKSEIIEIEIFRKLFFFRKMNPQPLTFLQLIESLMPFLTNEKQINSKNTVYSKIFEGIQKEFISDEKHGEIVLPKNSAYLNIIKNDIAENIKDFFNNITVGKTNIDLHSIIFPKSVPRYLITTKSKKNFSSQLFIFNEV